MAIRVKSESGTYVTLAKDESKVACVVPGQVGGELILSDVTGRSVALRPFAIENAKAGDRVNFVAPEAIYTQEGTLLIPANSKVVATVLKIEKPKWFNKNARVYLNFECIVFPDGSAMAMSAKPFTKDGALKEGPWMTAAKLAGSTVGLGAVGAGAGVGFAFIPNPAKLGTGFAIGIPVGCTVGLITGLVTPGLKYHAKAGEAVKIILCKDLCLKKVQAK